MKKSEPHFQRCLDFWQPMRLAPTYGPVYWVLVQLKDGTEIEAHYAFDLNGEDCPKFEGWFDRKLCQVFPVAWKHTP